MKDNTTDEVKNFINSNKQEGIGFFIMKNHKGEREFRKDIIKNISHSKMLELGKYFKEECVGVKFIPYGFMKDFDEVIKEMVDGPFEEQLPE